MTPSKLVKIGVALLIAIVATGALLRVAAGPADPSLVRVRLADWLRTASPVNTDTLPRRMTVAVVSSATTADPGANLRGIAEMAGRIRAEHPDVRLVVFGEASLGLYHADSLPNAYQRRVAEPIPGSATDSIAAVARRLGVYVAVGLIERTDSALFNSLVVVDPAGRIIGMHRKQFLHVLDEENGVRAAAPNAEVVDIEGFRVGLAICADANSRALVDAYRDRIDLLLYSVTSAVPFTVGWRRMWPPARTYGAWVLAANRYGTEGTARYPGTAFVAAPNGALQAFWPDGAGYVVAVVGRR